MINAQTGQVTHSSDALSRSVIRIKAIADHRFSMDVPRLIWLSLDLLAQVSNEDPQVLSISRMLWTPNKVEQFQVRYWLPPVQNEVLQEFKLLRREVTRLSMRDYLSALEVNLQTRGNEWLHSLFCKGRSSDC